MRPCIYYAVLHAGQEEVFEALEPLAVSVLQGFNVCIMAYGQVCVVDDTLTGVDVLTGVGSVSARLRSAGQRANGRAEWLVGGGLVCR